ncbi:MAG: phytoene/squalene synthase family protein [Flavobacteriales bacterium]|nr:MAG: phytoene/squalene synthase family protein [Flavobacteriales bacterium]
MQHLYNKVSASTSKMVTNVYSTSFSLGIYCLDKKFHEGIYAIYGFVRLADEIVDTFHEFPKENLLDEFEKDTFDAIDRGISLNPILQSFQWAVNTYNIDHENIRTFLKSMRMDLSKQSYDLNGYEDYILGSAEVVGLMCLSVFLEGDKDRYEELKFSAMKLGSAFQKINFLRDLHADYFQLGRVYFPGIDMKNFDAQTKIEIERDIEIDFKAGFEGIKQLPRGVRFGVYVAYVYYYALFQRIKGLEPNVILQERVRIPNRKKYRLLLSSYLRHSFNAL